MNDKQISANQADAAGEQSARPYPRNADTERSASGRGPRTEEGENRSRLNAVRHGLTGQVSAMTPEDRAAHDAFSKGIVAGLKPEGAMELQLAQRVATDSWRLNRISAIEDNLYALGHEANSGLCAVAADEAADRPYPRDGQSERSTGGQQIDSALAMARTYQQQSEQLQRLTLYEQRLNRAVQKNLGLLKQLQAERKAEHEARMKEAKLLLQLSERKGQEYQPARDGFVFSNDQIRASIGLEQRLDRARHIDFGTYRPGRIRLRPVLIPENAPAAGCAGGQRAA